MTEDVEKGSGTPSKDARRSSRRPLYAEDGTPVAPGPISGTLSPQELSPISPPRSGRQIRSLPLVNKQHSNPQLLQEPNLIHPVLNRLPLQFRFVCNGFLSNLLFMVVYNLAVGLLSDHYAPSTIYSAVYFLYIPAGHLMVSLLVFGWPERYFPSLMSNFPIGLTAIALGGALTAYLDRIEFNEYCAEMVRSYFTFSTMPARSRLDDQGEFYSSLVILFVTSVWTYILSVYINRNQAKSDKKEN